MDTTEERYDRLMNVLTDILVELRQLREGPSKAKETFGIRPDVMYSDRDLQDKFDVCEKTTKDWRNQGLKFFQKQPGKKGSRIWHLGQDVIDFYAAMAMPLHIPKPRPIPRDFPKGEKK